MTNLFRSREGALADVNVKTQLTTLGSQTAPVALLVPGDAKFLRAAYVAAVSSNEAADQYAFLVRLEGPGLTMGDFVFAAGAGGVSVATGGHALVPSQRIPINIPVISGQEILIFAEAVGDDMGTYQVGVTLEFGTEAGPEGETKGEITVEGDITAVDTLTRLTSQGSVTSPSRLTPPDAAMIKRVIVSVGADGAADGEVTYILRLSGNAMKNGEQEIIIGAESQIAGQAGSDEGLTTMVPMILDNLDIEVRSSDTLDISVEMAGVDVGSATAVVTVIFQ
ncbi:hypothetical protein L0Y40_01270 [Candidatus Wolfebacteria bacterium]|nr:hypothetical protein [Candidatus Wolfebacteria bacterium]